MTALAAVEELIVPSVPTDNEATPAADLAEPIDLPPPRDIKAVFQGGMFVLMLLAACYAAAEIILPLVVALVLMLVLQPAMRVLEKVRVPRGLAAALIILALLGAAAGLGTVLSGPATTWAQKLPEGIPKLQERLSFLAKPITALQNSSLAPKTSLRERKSRLRWR